MKTYLIILLLGFTMCTQKQEVTNPPKPGNAELNKQIVSTIFKQAINNKNISILDSFFTPGVIDHSAWEGQEPGLKGVKKGIEGLYALLPDLKVNTEDMIASGDLIATRETWKGSDIKTKKVVTGETMHFFKISNGKVTDAWSKGWDWLPQP